MTGRGPMTGRVFSGRYEVGERIGIGGMAEVYSAQDSVLGRIVAIKVMLPQYAEDPDFARRFRQKLLRRPIFKALISLMFMTGATMMTLISL